MTSSRFAIIATVCSLTLALSAPAFAGQSQKKSAKPAKVTVSRTPGASTKVAPAVGPAPVAYAAPRAPSSAMGEGAALEVRGQSRNLSMMLVLKNKKRDIDFVKPRENYSREVQNTSY